MLGNRAVRYFVATLASVLAFGCNDNGTAPTASLQPPTTTVAFRGFSGGHSVRAVRWLNGSGGGGSASATIGSDGGIISIPGADFSIVFPLGALAQNTRITIVPDANGYVGYEMLPHGLTFAVPVIAVQGLGNVAASGAVFCAYLEGDHGVGGDGTATASEIETSTTKFVRRNGASVPVAQIWTLNHFSRYILASGVTSDSAPPPTY